ncbi:MAG: hypothetical protein ACTSW3_09015 [Promethearchaeota archaeon]
MKTKDYDKIFLESFDSLKNNLLRIKGIEDIIVKGSLNRSQSKLPYWSDLDISAITKKTSFEQYTHLSNCYSLFKKKYPKIKLSLTLINEKDNLQTNCLHHHGIKPIAFNFELRTQNNNSYFSSKMSQPNKDAIVLNSVYRYYEILYDFRKNVIQNKISDIEFVSKYFHRASRFIRTQFEILKPELFKEKNIIDEEYFVKDFNYEAIVKDFFEIKRDVRKNWLNIINDDERLKYFKKYLIEKIEDLNDYFIPKLIKISKGYSKNDLN